MSRGKFRYLRANAHVGIHSLRMSKSWVYLSWSRVLIDRYVPQEIRVKRGQKR